MKMQFTYNFNYSSSNCWKHFDRKKSQRIKLKSECTLRERNKKGIRKKGKMTRRRRAWRGAKYKTLDGIRGQF